MQASAAVLWRAAWAPGAAAWRNQPPRPGLRARYLTAVDCPGSGTRQRVRGRRGEALHLGPLGTAGENK